MVETNHLIIGLLFVVYCWDFASDFELFASDLNFLWFLFFAI